MDTVAVWAVGSSVTTTANANIAPNGTLTATAVFPAATFSQLSNLTVTTSSSSTPYTVSCYFKSAGKGFAYIQINNGPESGIATGAVTIDLSNGNVGTPFSAGGGTLSNMSATSNNVGNGWYRLNFSFTTRTSSTFIYVYPGISDSQNARPTTASTTNGVYMWGAQLEQLAFPTSYIPTGASQVTRAADNASMAGTNFSSWYNQAQGTFYTSYTFNSTTSAILATQSASGFNYREVIYQSGQIYYGIFNQVSAGTPVANAYTQLAMNYSQEVGARASLNGATAVTLGAPSSTVTPIFLQIGDIGGTGNQNCNTRIRKIAYYPIAVTSAQMQVLTAN
jgi:hypothetical protein